MEPPTGGSRVRGHHSPPTSAVAGTIVSPGTSESAGRRHAVPCTKAHPYVRFVVVEPLGEFTSIDVFTNAVTALIPERAPVLVPVTPDLSA